MASIILLKYPVPNTVIFGNKFAMMSDISNFEYDLHSYIIVIGADLDPKRVCFWRLTPTLPVCETLCSATKIKKTGP